MKKFNIRHTFFNVNIAQRFFTHKKFLTPKVVLYYWEPFPNRILGLRNNPLLGHMSGGDTGHISLEIYYSSGEKFYLSVWPKEIPEDIPGECCLKKIKPAINSSSLEEDIEAEKGRKPKEKIIEINALTEKKVYQYVEKLKIELKKDLRIRVEWSLINNCAAFISDLLYECGIILTKQLFISTPHYVFHMSEKFEQEIHLKQMVEPSYKD